MKRLLLAVLMIAVPAFAQEWKIEKQKNAMDGITITTAILDSDTTDAGAKASLVIRYTGDKAEVYVVTDEVLDDEFVRVKFDDEKPETQV